MKKVIAIILAMFTMLAAAGCSSGAGGSDASGGSGSGGKNNKEIKEPITLTFASWAPQEFAQHLANKFEQEYDYITVELVQLEQNTWEQGLFNLASTGDLPDAFLTFDLASATVNGWTKDITEIYNKDEYTKKIPEGIKAAGVYNGKRYGMAVQQFPQLVFINKSLLEQANVPMPSYEWTMDDLTTLVKQMTIPNQNIFGIGNAGQFSDLFPALYSTDRYQWGFSAADQTFDFTEWANGYKYTQGLLTSRYAMDVLDAAGKESAYGDPGIWGPETGKLAVQMDWYWTNKYMKSDAFTDKGMEWMIYPLPKGSSGRTQTVLDFGAVSESCKYPEEAYNLLKYMTFGAEGWKARKEWYSFNHARPTELPLATDDEVWGIVKAFTPGEDYDALYASLDNAVGDVKKWIPGYGAWWAWTWEQEYWGKLERNEIKPEDVAPQMAKKMKTFYDEALAQIDARGQ